MCCGQEESDSQTSSTREGYLVVMPSVDSSDSDTETPTWTGETLTVNPTVDIAISLADIQVMSCLKW